MIADLHCHYPMHLLARQSHPHGMAKGLWEEVQNRFDEEAVDIAGRVFNNKGYNTGWRVSLEGLVRGRAGIVCSVLYWPEGEFRLGSHPAPGSFAELRSLLTSVEADLKALDPGAVRHLIVRRASDLDDQSRIRFVHCVEGGFHLGPDEGAIDAQVRWLDEHGVLYITLAHLFFKGVAANAPAIPPLSDSEFETICPTAPGTGLTAFGKAAVRAMHRHKVLIDISHMRQDAIDDTFTLVEQLDRERGTDPRDFPVLATHVGMRAANPDVQEYNLSPETAERIQARDGLIGFILAQHQIGSTATAADSQAALRRHIEQLAAVGNGLGSCAIGSDVDGFIKPTLVGFESADDYPVLEGWIRADFPGDAAGVLHDNAARVLRRVLAARDAARNAGVPRGPDGFCHPATESELVSVVKQARAEGRQLRVRGAAHSVAHVIYTDPLTSVPNGVSEQSPPSDGDNMNVMLDRYRGWHVRDASKKLVEADAGIHLGADPSDPTGTATAVETSLLSQLWERRQWTLSNLGGITHQTVSGFTATGSSGGSVQHSVNDDLWGFRIIDGDGTVHELTCEDTDPDPFYSMSPNLGLLGVVSTIIFRCVEAYNITGQEAVSTVEDCAIDLFGPGTRTRPSLEQFLRKAEYARLEWWPQRGAERVTVWQAQRIAPQPGFLPTRYVEFTAHPGTAELAISLLLTVFGNLEDLSRTKPQINLIFGRVEAAVARKLQRLGVAGKMLAKLVTIGAKLWTRTILIVLAPFGGRIERKIPAIFPRLLNIFVKFDSDKSGTEKGEPQAFRDYAWQGLPMDNAADDELLKTSFTEIWVPLARTQEVMNLLRGYFNAPQSAQQSYRRTGLNAWELYAAKPTRLWMSASHTNGEDDWKDGAFRIDPYWFAANPGDPAKTFYPQFWELLRDHHVPFRLHWGKYQPATDQKRWPDFFKSQYPRWDDFLDLRATRDPAETFLTSYWRERFDI